MDLDACGYNLEREMRERRERERQTDRQKSGNIKQRQKHILKAQKGLRDRVKKGKKEFSK